MGPLPFFRFCCTRCRPAAILLRHAEVPSGAGADPPLSAAGQARAAALADVIGPAGVDKVIVSSFRRTQETAAPAAGLLGLTPAVHQEPAGILAAIGTLPRSATALVVGHTNTVPEVVAGLGGGTVVIAATAFDNLFVLAGGRLTHLRYGA